MAVHLLIVGALDLYPPNSCRTGKTTCVETCQHALDQLIVLISPRRGGI